MAAPAVGRASTRRATPRVSHGDTTGNKAIDLGKEHAAAVRAREGELGMVNPLGGIPPEEPIDEPIDLTPEALAYAAEAAERAQEEADAAVETMSSGAMTMEALAPDRPRNALRSVSRDGKVDPNAVRVIKFNDYYEGVTLGIDPESGQQRTFNFEPNRGYRVSQWVADHFADKDMLASY